MGETRREELLREVDARLAATDVALAERYPGPATGRHPVHTVYLPADRYDAGAVADWGEAGSAALAEHGGDDAELAAVLGIPVQLLGPVRARVAAKLHREPVEDLRVDFEDATAAAPTPRRTWTPRPPGRCSARPVQRGRPGDRGRGRVPDRAVLRRYPASSRRLLRRSPGCVARAWRPTRAPGPSACSTCSWRPTSPRAATPAP